MKKTKLFSRKSKLCVLAVLMLVALLCCSACGTAVSNAPDDSGSVGTIKWKYTSSDKKLEISGDGEMTDDYKTSSELPWSAVLSSVKKVVVKEGVLSIGSRAFYGASNLETVELAPSVTRIGDLSFAYCKALKEIKLPSLLTAIGEGAFEGCASLETVNVDASLTSLGRRAFAFCSSLKSVYVFSPVEIMEETFFGCSSLETVVFSAEISSEMVSDAAFKNTDMTYDKIQKAVNNDAKVNVTVKYQYDDGNQAAPDKVVTIGIGEDYSVNSPEIDGFEVSQLTVSGKAPAENTEILVIYTPKAVETQPVEDETAEPTDDKDNGANYVALVIMIVAIAGICVGGYFLMKSNKKNEEKAKNQNKAKNRKQ